MSPSASPVLSVVVPAYDAEAYLRRALDPLAGVHPDVEVVVVDDGSTDGTAAVAQEYVDAHPGLVRLVRQPNGGHGSAINTGLEHARGTYLKVVDADDWLDPDALDQVLATLRGFVAEGREVDLLVSNFVYEKVGKRTKTVVRYRGALPADRTVGWSATRGFGKRQYLMMHALTYRTAVLRAAGLRLPAHTFYVDNLYALVPLAHVRTLHYLDVDLYRYFIGRADQSVQEAVMLRRMDQQARVNRLMLDHVSQVRVTDRRLRAYRLHYVGLICTVSSILLIRAGTRESLAERDRLWSEPAAAGLLAVPEGALDGARAGLSNLPGRAGRRVSVLAYRVAQRAIGFGRRARAEQRDDLRVRRRVEVPVLQPDRAEPHGHAQAHQARPPPAPGSAAAVSGGHTGSATTTCAGCRRRSAATAARTVDPVAAPSSTTTTVRPVTGSAGRSRRKAASRRRRRTSSAARTASNASAGTCAAASTRWFSTTSTVPSIPASAPIASSGCPGRPRLAHDQDVERRVQGRGHGRRDGHPAAGQREHDGGRGPVSPLPVVPVRVGREPPRERGSRLRPVGERLPARHRPPDATRAAPARTRPVPPAPARSRTEMAGSCLSRRRCAQAGSAISTSAPDGRSRRGVVRGGRRVRRGWPWGRGTRGTRACRWGRPRS